MSIVDDVKKLISGTTEEKLVIIESMTKKRLARLLGEKEVPEAFDDITKEVTLKRFNRIGQEGMTSYGQDGESFSFPDSDFAEYMEEINDHKRKDDDRYGPRRGGFGFV